MSQVISKFAPIYVSCMEHVHPWTTSCTNASAGLLFQAVPESLRIYTAVYMFSLLMRGRLPTKTDLQRTVKGILQSTLFLTTNAYTFTAFVCLLRKLFGRFYFPTVTYIPTFLASLCAILLERPSRRNLLTFYVANVATESYWRMLVDRGLVKSLPYGQVVIFSLSSAVCAYLFRAGWHLQQKDSFFGSLRFVVGKNEEYNFEATQPVQARQGHPASRPRKNNAILNEILNVYAQTVDKLKNCGRHSCCPHNHSCLSYVAKGGASLFTVGIGIQFTLSVIFNVPKIIKRPGTLREILCSKDFTKIAVFLGGYNAIFRTVSCLMRHVRGKDTPENAIPAGLAAGVAFAAYPNVSVALYVMWKTFQFIYAFGNSKGYLPNVPGFSNFLYCAFTATLFHVAMFEPQNLRGSYWKFLDRLSGGRIAFMSRLPLDVYGLESTKHLEEVLVKTKTRTDLKFLF